jgi:hypothetical protein
MDRIETQQELNNMMAEAGLSQAMLSRCIGKSTTGVNRWFINGPSQTPIPPYVVAFLKTLLAVPSDKRPQLIRGLAEKHKFTVARHGSKGRG